MPVRFRLLLLLLLVHTRVNPLVETYYWDVGIGLRVLIFPVDGLGAGTLLPRYDPDSKLLYLAPKGATSIYTYDCRY